jgi:hypothetical protein
MRKILNEKSPVELKSKSWVLIQIIQRREEYSSVRVSTNITTGITIGVR